MEIDLDEVEEVKKKLETLKILGVLFPKILKKKTVLKGYKLLN